MADSKSLEDDLFFQFSKGHTLLGKADAEYRRRIGGLGTAVRYEEMEMTGEDGVFTFEEDDAFDGVLQFPHISRPGMG